jgi:hypothetical protein
VSFKTYPMVLALEIRPAGVLRCPRHAALHRPTAVRAGDEWNVWGPAEKRTAA